MSCAHRSGLSAAEIRAPAESCVRYAMLEDEYCLKGRLEVLKQGVALFADKYSAEFSSGGKGT